MRAAILLVVLVGIGCGEDEGITLLVDVRTDLRPGVEFAAVEVEVRGAGADRTASAPALASHDFLGGRRVAEIGGLGAGDVTVHVALVDAAGGSVAQRSIEIALEGDAGVTAVITRSCIDVRCPGAGEAPTKTECHGGRCVDARCHTGHSDTCGAVECATDAMCANGDPCSVGACAAGVCLLGPVASCVPDAGMDASTPDAGSRDAGQLDAQRRDAGPPDAGPPRDCTDDASCLAGEVCRDNVCQSSCRPAWLSPYDGAGPCSSEFFSCISACTDAACQVACFEAEPMREECYLCVNTNLAVCYNAAGCGAVWSCFAACADGSDCPDPFSDCALTTCQAELDSWQACVDGSTASCTSSALDCGP